MALIKTGLALCVAAFFSAAALAQGEPQSDSQPPQAEETEHFDIERFEIEGNSLLGENEIEALLRELTGKQREYGDVQRALELLENRYKEKGYAAVQVYVP